MPLRKDIWRPAIVRAPIGEIVARGTLEGFALQWLPASGSFRFLADPFGLWRAGRLYVFVETYDYRDRIGAIECLVYDADLRLIERGPALAERWHLSYPHVFEAEGETWMLPEAHRSGRLTLYRATAFPYRWQAETVIGLDHVAIDATLVLHAGRWWLFSSSADREEDKTGALYLASADRLAGPWTPHPGNPVRVDRGGARPGGTPFVTDAGLLLPVQDCRSTYGAAISPLVIDTLDTASFRATLGPRLTAPPAAAPFVEGLHTLSAAGAVTLVDMKRTELSLRGLAIQARERLTRRRRARTA